jgi:hypothetical protein
VVVGDSTSDQLTVTANGSFTFKTAYAQGQTYAVTLVTASTGGEPCTITNPSGTIATGNVNNVSVNCGHYTIGGTVSGLTSSETTQITLTAPNGNAIVVVGNGAFTFPAPVYTGAGISVTAGPVSDGAELCGIANIPNGAITANVTTLNVTCSEVVVQINPTIIFNTLSVTANSVYGITSVTATVDGTSLGTQNSGNAAFPLTGVSAGNHTAAATATDGNGVSASATQQITVNNPPTAAFTAPANGQMVNTSSLQVSGTFATDFPGGTVSATLALGGANRTSAPVTLKTSPFNTSLNLSGVAPGAYPLLLTVTDNFGLQSTASIDVLITPLGARIYTPVTTSRVYDGGEYDLFAANAGYLVVGFKYNFQLVGVGVFAIATGVGTNPPLAFDINNSGAPVYSYYSGWAVDATGTVYANHPETYRPGLSLPATWFACPINGSCIDFPSTYELSNGLNVPEHASFTAVHYPWVLWTLNEQQFPDAAFFLTNLDSNQTSVVPFLQPGCSAGSADFAATGSDVTVAYAATCNGSSNVYLWQLTSNVVTPITSDNASSGTVFNGTQAAWLSNATSPATLYTYTLSSGATAKISAVTSSGGFQLSNNVIAWLDGGSLYASDGTKTSFLAGSAGLVGVSGGYVFYLVDGTLYDWSPQGGEQLLFNSFPIASALSFNKTVYFVVNSVSDHDSNVATGFFYSATLP